MYGYIYRTHILDNGKMYIGQKKSEVFLGEKYIGSGGYLLRSIKKHRYTNFKVELIEWCNSREELNEREIYWIAYYDAVKSDIYYNKARGGDAGAGREPGFHQPESQKRKLSEMQRDGKSWMCGKHHSEETKKKMSASRSGEKHPMYGKHHSESSRQKMSDAKKKNLPKQCGSGKDNPMTNRVWINNGTQSKAIKPVDLDTYLSNGFVLGRLLNAKWMNKDGQNRQVPFDLIEQYQNQGWVLGMYRSKCN